jgi:hypothetical protein
LDEIRGEIYELFKEYSDSVSKLGGKDLGELFNAYDERCLNGDVQKYMKDVGYSLEFKTAGEPTFTTEGICTLNGCDYVITIPIGYFKDIKGTTNVAGHLCKDQLECLMRVMEHELVHLLIFVYCKDIFITDQHGPLFMNLANDMFRHTDHRHYIF